MPPSENPAEETNRPAGSTSGKLAWKEKIGYASGDFASCLYFGIFMNFLTYYYTDIYGISAAAVGTMILATRTWDWINDPIMGLVADRTHNRRGKYRPWLLWIVPPWVAIGILTFTSFGFSGTSQLIYAYVTYTLLTMAYTAINVPYSALMGVMTPNSSERTVLASYRFIGAFSGTLLVNATMLYLISVLGQGNDKLGTSLTVSIYAVMSAALFIITYASTRERVKPPKSQSTSVTKDLGAILQNGPWIVMFIVSILTIIWIAVRNGVVIHYFKYASGSEHWGSVFLVVASIIQLVGVLFTKKVTLWFGGKKNAFLGLTLICATLISLFYFISPTNIPLVMAHQLVSSFIAAPLMPLFWSMIADTADYGAWKLGQRSTALIFSSGTSSQKAGWSIGPAIGMWLLAYYGFEANVEQSPETLHGLQLIMSWWSAGFALLAAIAVLFYKIDHKTELEMEAAMKASTNG